MNRSKILISLIILTVGVIMAGGILWFNLVYSGETPQPSVSCSANPSGASINSGQTVVVTFTANAQNFECERWQWTGTKASDLGCSSATSTTCNTVPFSSSVTGNDLSVSCSGYSSICYFSLTVTSVSGGGTTGHSVLKVEIQ